MKRSITVLTTIILLLAFAQSYAGDYKMTKKAGNYTVTVTMDKNPPVTGLNKMAVGIKDAEGKDVTDAAVMIDYIMPAMPGMPAMNYKAGAILKNKDYVATLNFSMSGAWTVGVKITRAGKIQTVKLNVDVK